MPNGSNITFLPVASWNVSVTGIDPPSRVKSGSTPKTSLIAYFGFQYNVLKTIYVYIKLINILASI